MLHWFAGFDDNGIWCPQRAAQSILKNPLSKSAKNKSSKQQQKQTSAQTTSSQQSTEQSSSKTKTSAASSNTNSGSTSGRVHVASQFRINLSHVPPGQSDKLFHAFAIPADGNCLFSSYIKALHLSTTISTLRNQVVDFISQDPDPMRRLSAMNAHIGRETEAQNPNWVDQDLFDPGTDLNPAQLDIRFSTLWCQYSDEMRANSWAGIQFVLILFILISLSHLYFIQQVSQK